jgi:VWFA-related protein
MPVFRSNTELVLVPVTVNDHSGKHISGLTKEDFVVKQDGKEQKIGLFEEVVGASAAPEQKAPRPANTYSNQYTDEKPRNLVIIAIDQLNTPGPQQADARKALMKYLSDNHRSDMLISLVSFNRSGVRVLHDFTNDTDSLLAFLKNVQTKQSLGQAQTAEATTFMNNPDANADARAGDFGPAVAALIEAERNNQLAQWDYRARVTMDALQQIARAYHGVPGRKSLIWATSSIPLMFNDPDLNTTLNDQQRLNDTASFASLRPAMERTWELLNSANIAVYPVATGGLESAMIATDTGLNHLTARSAPERQRLFSETNDQTMRLVADTTGGEVFHNTNDLAKAFNDAAGASSSYYMIGFYRDKKDEKPGWHKLKVNVDRSGLEVRSRSGYFISPPPKSDPEAKKRDVTLGLDSPMEFTGIPMQIEWIGPMMVKGKKMRAFELIIPPHIVEIDGSQGNKLSIEVAGMVRNKDGKPVADFSQTMEAKLNGSNLQLAEEKGITYRNGFNLPPGDYFARVVVRDNLTGRMGSVFAPLKVTD